MRVNRVTLLLTLTSLAAFAGKLHAWWGFHTGG
jgi:hypothetical protein